MKADRLISILMLLQLHKQLTANELAKRLEVSVRTIYRDVESLSGLGIPIYTELGATGGIKLLGDYKTTLTGLNKDELYSLFIPTGDKILEDLGFEKVKDTTILKLLGDSSKEQVDEIFNIQNYLHIDLTTWSEPKADTNKEILPTLQDGIWNQYELVLEYQKINELKKVVLKPLGLVCKRGIWYLIGENKEIIKTYKVAHIQSARLTSEVFKRPTEFSLEGYWKNSTSLFKSKIPKITFTYQVHPTILNHIKSRPFITITNISHIGDSFEIDIPFDAMFQGIEFAFTYGKDIKIITPTEAIIELKQKADDIMHLYCDK